MIDQFEEAAKIVAKEERTDKNNWRYDVFKKQGSCCSYSVYEVWQDFAAVKKSYKDEKALLNKYPFLSKIDFSQFQVHDDRISFNGYNMENLPIQYMRVLDFTFEVEKATTPKSP